MPSSIVVDASAFAAVLFKEPEGDVLADSWASSVVVAPSLLCYEIGNVALTKARRYPEEADDCFEAYDIFLRLRIQFAEVGFCEALALAQRRNLTIYDASYAWLALSRGLDLISLDRRLIAAFEAEKSATHGR
ncbi:MAG: type II toxin-antitoxin system VapC family toxin [Alphaproteobacteria bacterium]|nr:type II toxin-antitoxin system VapC family toxin [Alphaproteobacteria bacterium]MBM3625052.1 type II toxin-antitoxin system VapC family toxin [Alphaproteobacteria bacterium]MBM3651926.1 type II toxin-antitoxin system VapC family toxin [Alphaproteobacteria bacterium]